MPDPNEPNTPAVVEPPIVVQEPPTTPGFHDDLEPDLKASPSILKFKDKNTLARSYVNLEKELGKRVGLPDFEKGDQKDVDAFWGKLGVPNAPEGYKLVPPKFPDGSGLEFAKEDLDSFSKLAHEARLTPKAAQRVLELFAERVIESKSRHVQEQSATRQEHEAKLKEAWGAGFQMNTGYADRVAQQFGDEEFKAGAEATGVKDQPWFKKFLARVGRAMGEDNLLVGESTGQTIEGVKAELEQIKADPAYWKNDDRAKHDKLVARALDLQRIISGA